MRVKFDQSNLDGCLVQGRVDVRSIMYVFDALPKDVRDAINYSPYKLCVACVYERGRDITTVREMEAKIATREPNWEAL